MSAIKVEETLNQASQSVRVILRNEFGHMVHDMTLPLVTTVERDGVLEHSATDVDAIIAEHAKMHEERHQVFLEAARKRGHIR
jgi:hypothetical protein